MAKCEITIVAAAVFAALFNGGEVCLADFFDRALIGAWAPSGPDCARVFERQGAILSFRRPTDSVTLAIIVRPEEIVFTTGACRVQDVSRTSDASMVNADCDEAAGSAAQTVQIRLKSANEIFVNRTGDSARDVRLIKCRFDPGAPGRS